MRRAARWLLLAALLGSAVSACDFEGALAQCLAEQRCLPDAGADAGG